MTDLLIALYNKEDVLDEIKSRYDAIIDYLKLDLDLSDEFDEIKKNISNGTTLDYAASIV